ncbi:MAG TPA: hypothetical protein VM511_06655, partial [Luteolibacter sp.]|nr:hypothetical protein [Luteolibacter sp.]
MSRPVPRLIATPLAPAILLSLFSPTRAEIITWKSNPPDDDWHSAANWIGSSAPNSSDDTAVFGLSLLFNVYITEDFNLGALQFLSDVNRSYAIWITGEAPNGHILELSGAGVINDSTSYIPRLITRADPSGKAGLLVFSNSATAGHSSVQNHGAAIEDGLGGGTVFQDSSNAGTATISNFNGISQGGFTEFRDDSSAAQSTIIS